MKRLALAVALIAAACGAGATPDAEESTPLATIVTTTTSTSTSTTTSTTTTTTTTTTILPALAETAGEVTITGPALPLFGSGPDAAIGQTAPVVNGSSFDGSEVNIEPSGKFSVIMFLAHWCPHCRGEVEDLGPYFESSPPPDNVEVLSVSTGVRPAADNYPPSEWLTPDAWPVPVLIDTDDAAVSNAFGLNAFPFWVVLDPQGVVLGRNAGSLPQESVEALFENLAEREG
ncbi:MAG: TlpA family protein disulfide reductase [Acidimicrobiia bacterium]